MQGTRSTSKYKLWTLDDYDMSSLGSLVATKGSSAGGYC